MTYTLDASRRDPNLRSWCWQRRCACKAVWAGHPLGMGYHQKLARWANGENAFTALALAAGLEVQERTDVGVNGKALREEIARGKNDVAVAARVAALTSDTALLRRMARERRVAVRVAAMKNTHLPFEVLEDVLIREKNWDVRRAAEEAVKRRVLRMDPELAVSLLENTRCEDVLSAVAERAKLTDEHVLRVLSHTISVKNRWASGR